MAILHDCKRNLKSLAMIKIFNLTIARLLIYSFLEIYQRVFVGTHDMLTRLLQRATFMQRFVQSHRLLKELKLHTWRTEHSSCNIHHRPRVRIDSIQLKYPIVTSNTRIKCIPIYFI